MQETLRMVFRNTDDRLTSINLPDPDSAITAVDVGNVMDSILSTNIFTSTGGDLVSKVRAEVVSRDVNILSEF